MAPSLHELGLDCLSREARIAVAHALLESVIDPSDLALEDAPLSDAQRAELERRLQDSIDNPDAVTPWEVVRQRLRERVKA